MEDFYLDCNSQREKIVVAGSNRISNDSKLGHIFWLLFRVLFSGNVDYPEFKLASLLSGPKRVKNMSIS